MTETPSTGDVLMAASDAFDQLREVAKGQYEKALRDGATQVVADQIYATTYQSLALQAINASPSRPAVKTNGDKALIVWSWITAALFAIAAIGYGIDGNWFSMVIDAVLTVTFIAGAVIRMKLR